MVDTNGKTFTDLVRESSGRIYIGKRITNYKGEEFIVNIIQVHPECDGYQIVFRENGVQKWTKFYFIRDCETMQKILE